MCVKDDQHKAEIYKCLWLLLTEKDPDIFQKELETFISLWQEREPKFISYFQTYYTKRTGKCHKIFAVEHVISKSPCTIALTEKWALCFRHFDHKECDTNMLVERYVFT